MVSLTLIIQGVFLNTVNFKSFSSALENSKLIQVVFKDFKE
jgi:hypothetical protein